MRRSSVALITAVSTIALTQIASAADLSYRPLLRPEPVISWTGFYVGLNAGGAWGTQCVDFSGDPTTLAAIGRGQLPAAAACNPSGFIGGGQVGYNYAVGPFVFGIEADWQWSDVKASESVSTNIGGGFFPFVTTAEQKMDFIGTVRPRLGFTWSSVVLFYATGGLAYGDVKVSSSVQSQPGCPGFCGAASDSDLKVGWTAGAGAEWKFAPNWSAKIEYLYYDLGRITQTYSDSLGRFPGTFVSTETKLTGNIARVGVNYQF